MKTEIITGFDEVELNKKLVDAAKIIRSGGLVVFPTETVYGLGGDATNRDAAKKIYAAKGRPSDNPLIIHIEKPEDAEKYTYTNSAYYKLAERFMPGPITVVLRSKENIPRETRGGLDTVAVRCPENSIARSLIALCGVPIAAPSANLSGSPSPTMLAHVVDDMNGRVDMIIDGGACDIGLESTIVAIDECEKATLLRPGKITLEELAEVLGEVNIASAVTDKLKDGEAPKSPGMKYRHYAPRASLVLLDGNKMTTFDYIKSKKTTKTAVICYNDDAEKYQKIFDKSNIYTLGNEADEVMQAKMLFSKLRDTDKKNYDIIYAPLPKKEGMGLALYNRMIRAAAHTIIKL